MIMVTGSNHPLRLKAIQDTSLYDLVARIKGHTVDLMKVTAFLIEKHEVYIIQARAHLIEVDSV
jgi:hypothetical protein